MLQKPRNSRSHFLRGSTSLGFAELSIPQSRFFARLRELRSIDLFAFCLFRGYVTFTGLFNNMRTLKFKPRPTNAFFDTVSELHPASDYCQAQFRCLNCAQRIDYHVTCDQASLPFLSRREGTPDTIT